MQFTCQNCGTLADKPSGHVNRSHAKGMKLYCSKVCSGLARRANKTEEQKKEEKRLYDIEYRSRNVEPRRAQKAAYYQRTKNPEKEAEKRKERMPKHIEYCRRPEYKAWKKKYDREYRAEKNYGEFSECFLLVMDIRDECLSKMTDYDIRMEKGTLNKRAKRRNEDERLVSNNLEIGTLGNIERR